MAYSELIKNFKRIRAYLRSFYVYGFRYRNDYKLKSSRSYDNERRRIESWLGDYMYFRQDTEGRRVFLSVDSRAIPENPLYRAFRAKSFTDRDITLHFHLLDILDVSEGLAITDIMDELSYRLNEFEGDLLPDESTVRKKLKEYVSLGLISRKRQGRETHYLLNEDEIDLPAWETAVSFFSEAAPLGVIGSFIGSRFSHRPSFFRFKHHYILNALESEIIFDLFIAMEESRLVTLTTRGQKIVTLPLKMYFGTQTGRQYLLAWSPKKERFSFYRLDLIESLKKGKVFNCPDDLDERTNDFSSHVWGVAGSSSLPLQHIEMTVYAEENEDFIVQRLLREKRCGEVERVDDRHWRFWADVYSPLEILPWLRTFTGRITDLQCSDPFVTKRFRDDVLEMEKMYEEE